jgi:site-specific recombinase XerD
VEKHLFTYNGLNIQHVSRAFKAVVKRAGIEDSKFPHVKYTFASNLAIKGASLKDLQELLGYMTISMTKRYAHLSQNHKKKAVNLLKGLTVSSEVHRRYLSQNCHISKIRSFVHRLSY